MRAAYGLPSTVQEVGCDGARLLKCSLADSEEASASNGLNAVQVRTEGATILTGLGDLTNGLAGCAAWGAEKAGRTMNMPPGARLSAAARASFTTVALQPLAIERLATKADAALVGVPAFANPNADAIGGTFDAVTRRVGAFTADTSGLLRVTDLGTAFDILEILNADQSFDTGFGTTGFTG